MSSCFFVSNLWYRIRVFFHPSSTPSDDANARICGVTREKNDHQNEEGKKKGRRREYFSSPPFSSSRGARTRSWFSRSLSIHLVDVAVVVVRCELPCPLSYILEQIMMTGNRSNKGISRRCVISPIYFPVCR